MRRLPLENASGLVVEAGARDIAGWITEIPNQ
jgi:hypothetical protein